MIEIGKTTATMLDYDTAWLYTITSTYNNKYDWRMPSWYEWGVYTIIPQDAWTDNLTPVDQWGNLIYNFGTLVRDIKDDV